MTLYTVERIATRLRVLADQLENLEEGIKLNSLELVDLDDNVDAVEREIDALDQLITDAEEDDDEDEEDSESDSSDEEEEEEEDDE